MVEHLVEDTYSHSGYVMGKSRAESGKIAQLNKTARSERREDPRGILPGSSGGGAFDYGDKMLSEINQTRMRKFGNRRSACGGEKVTRIEAALQLFEDEMDHYGNFVVYVRMNGVVPPDTAVRQQQMKERMDHDQH